MRPAGRRIGEGHSHSPLEEAVLAMDDDRFDRALAAWSRCLRRRSRTERPEGDYDDEHCWHPHPHEHSVVVERMRPPTRSFPQAYLIACRSLEHCEALEGADRGATLTVRYWLEMVECRLRQTPQDPRAYRLALKLERQVDAHAPGALPARRPRL
jgi:hypothetical protein